MEGTETKNFVKSKVLEYLENVQVFYKTVQSNMVEQKDLVEKVKKIKSDEGEEGFKNATEHLVRIQELHYNTFLLDQSVKQSQGLLYEYNTMAKLFNVELGLEGEELEFFNQAVKTSPHLFVVEKGKASLLETEETTVAMAALEERMSSEKNLKNIYQSM